MEARLPTDNLIKCRSLLQDLLGRIKKGFLEGITVLNQSLIDSTRSHILRRLINLTVGIRRPRYLICLNRETKADLEIWLEFLTSYNGRSFFLDYVLAFVFYAASVH